MKGELSVLNVGAGDLRIEIGTDEAENAKTLDMIDSMLKNGYAILVHVGPDHWERAIGVDRATMEYIFGRRVSMKETKAKIVKDETAPAAPADPKARVPGRRGRGGRARIAETRATSVARSAGGCNARTPEQWKSIAQQALRE